MRKRSLCKCFITLGLLLFFTLLLPFTSYQTVVAQAANFEPGKEKNDYKLNLKTLTIVKGKSKELNIYNADNNVKIIFKSDDQEIASVSENGIVTANKVGTTNITASVKDSTGVTNLTCEVTVGPPAISVKCTQSRIILGINNDNVLLDVILKPANTAENAKFSSYNDKIASITSGGRITPNDYGMTYLFALIDATEADGSLKFAKSSVIVTSAENASKVETYFNDHPELNLISEADLTKALMNFFNGGTVKGDSTDLVTSLDSYLNGQFNLKSYRDEWKAREAALSKLSLNANELINGSEAL